MTHHILTYAQWILYQADNQPPWWAFWRKHGIDTTTHGYKAYVNKQIQDHVDNL